jgi:hypothetical protein
MDSAIKLLEKFTDAERLSIVADSKDWDIIVPGIAEYIEVLLSGKWNIVQSMAVLRIIIEVIYVMGYKRGKSENNPFLKWEVKE